jgi:hypothetical protein
MGPEPALSNRITVMARLLAAYRLVAEPDPQPARCPRLDRP